MYSCNKAQEIYDAIKEYLTEKKALINNIFYLRYYLLFFSSSTSLSFVFTCNNISFSCLLSTFSSSTRTACFSCFFGTNSPLFSSLFLFQA